MTSTAVFPANFPFTLHERTQAPDVLRAKATFEEYLELAEICPYNLDYINGEIASMSEASLSQNLMKQTAQWVQSQQVDSPFYLWVYEQNHPARAFYDSLGATNQERIRGDNGFVLRYVWSDTEKLANLT